MFCHNNNNTSANSWNNTFIRTQSLTRLYRIHNHQIIGTVVDNAISMPEKLLVHDHSSPDNAIVNISQTVYVRFNKKAPVSVIIPVSDIILYFSGNNILNRTCFVPAFPAFNVPRVIPIGRWFSEDDICSILEQDHQIVQGLRKRGNIVSDELSRN